MIPKVRGNGSAGDRASGGHLRANKMTGDATKGGSRKGEVGRTQGKTKWGRVSASATRDATRAPLMYLALFTEHPVKNGVRAGGSRKDFKHVSFGVWKGEATLYCGGVIRGRTSHLGKNRHRSEVAKDLKYYRTNTMLIRHMEVEFHKS